ncbi:MAG: hypothetical protein LUC93_18905 [Planctomycetaceae bacterium]|nr:hypothetical protein [Planctomycetaceae bacterium]
MNDSQNVINDSINHRQPARLPLDFGGSNTTGIHCSVVAELRDHYGLEKRPVIVHEPSQMLGLIEDDLADAMGVDTVHSLPARNSFGVVTDGNWKEWRTPWGQDVLVAAQMALQPTENGDILTYPEGDTSVPPSAKLNHDGYFFDALNRQGEFDEDDPNPDDNTEEFTLISDEDLALMVRHAAEAKKHNRTVISALPGTSFGDVSNVPAMFMKHPKGIRDVAEWYVSVAVRQEFIHEVFSKQADVAIANLQRIHAAVGDDAYSVVAVCGTDFGTQISTFCSKDAFIELYQPYYQKVNGWIHDNTSWKTFKHSCGAIEPFIEPLIESGFDILNPVQCSATGMDPHLLKEKYGERVVFWGGGIDTQQTLPFGTPDQVRAEALERCRIFSPGGGFVFNSIHNVQALTPIPNLVALLDAYKEFISAGK